MLNPDFRDILSEFVAFETEFLVVGAYALAAHGLPRATGDIDLWVRANAENANRVMKALAAFGAPLLDVTEVDFITPGMVVQVGVTPRRIDVLTAIDGVEFDDAWNARVELQLGGLLVPVISLPDLIKNKRASGRPKDLVDAETLEKQYGISQE